MHAAYRLDKSVSESSRCPSSQDRSPFDAKRTYYSLLKDRSVRIKAERWSLPFAAEKEAAKLFEVVASSNYIATAKQQSILL